MRRIIKLSFLLLIICLISLLSSCGDGYIEVGYNEGNSGYTTAQTIVRLRIKSEIESKKEVEVNYGYKFKMYPLSQNMIENSDLNQELKFTLYRTVTNKLNRINLEDDRVKEIYTFNETLNYFLNEKFYIENTKIYIDEIAKEDLDGYNYLEYSYKIEPIYDDYIKWYYKNDNNKLINPRTYNENPSDYWYGSCIIKYNISGNNIIFSK